MKIFVDHSLCAKSQLHVRLLESQTLYGHTSVYQSVKIEFDSVKDLIVCNAAHDNVKIKGVLHFATFNNKIQPFVGISVEDQNLTLLKRFVIQFIF